MADNSCSGGTPFKRIVDQQNRDASNQQDRLVNNNGGPSGAQVRNYSSRSLSISDIMFPFPRPMLPAPSFYALGGPC